MKKSVKIVMIVALCFLAVGLVICGALLPTVIRNGGSISSSLDAYVDRNLVVQPTEYADLSGVETIRFEGSSSGSLNVTSTTSQQLSADLTYNENHKNHEFTMEKVGSELVITHNGEHGWFVLGFGETRSTLDVKIPDGFAGNVIVNRDTADVDISDMQLDSLSLNLKTSNADLNGITCNTFVGKTSTGRLSATDFATSTLDISCTTGLATFEGTARDVLGNCGTGSLRLSFDNEPETMDVSGSTGSIDIFLPRNIEGFTIESDVSVGSYSNEFTDDHHGGGHHTNTYGNGKHHYKMKISTGNLNVYQQ